MRHVLDHPYIPHAEVLDGDGIDQFLAPFGLDRNDDLRTVLPAISIEDPVVQGLQHKYNLNSEDLINRVIRFQRRSFFAGYTDFFRIITTTRLRKENVHPDQHTV